MVATADPHATQAALDILKKGGNAVDAAIAAQWVLNVVEPQSSGIGGGGFFVYYDAASKKVFILDGREMSPAKAYPEMFLAPDGKPYPFHPDRITGGLPVGVPGTLKLLAAAHERFGSKKFSFADLFNPAIALAQNGFAVSGRLAHFIRQEQPRLIRFKSSRKIFLDKKGNPLPPGALLKQKDLAKTFRLIQKKGPEVFYEGKIAKAIVKAVKKAPFHPGLMELGDLKAYQVMEREPVKGNYRGYEIVSMPLPSSGGTTLIETLNMLEGFDMKNHARAEHLHVLSEAQKLAFQDRNLYLGDPQFVQAPLDKLLLKEYARERAQQIWLDRVIPSAQADPARKLENTHTSHLSIVDTQGNIVAYTTTIEYLFGSGLVVPGYGIVLNNELTDFEAVPTNEKGEPAANAVRGGKRPRSSMTPTIVFKDGNPVLVLGSPGGSKIIGAVLNVLLNVLDENMPLSDALKAPRAVNRDGPIELEPELFENISLKSDLEKRGNTVIQEPAIGNVQAVYFDRRKNVLIGESDPRGEGKAEGF